MYKNCIIYFSYCQQFAIKYQVIRIKNEQAGLFPVKDIVLPEARSIAALNQGAANAHYTVYFFILDGIHSSIADVISKFKT